MQRNFAAASDGQRCPRKRFVPDRSLNYIERRLQLRFTAYVHGLQFHRVGRHFDSEASFQLHARNGHRQVSAQVDLTKQRTSHGNLRHVADTERAQPGFGLRKTFDQIRTAECKRDDWFTGLINLLGERGLFRRHIHVPFAIADAYEQPQNCDIIRIRRGQFDIRRVSKSRIRADCRHRIEPASQFAFQIFAGSRFRIGVERQQQRSRWFCSIEWQPMRRVSKQRDSTIRNFLRLFLPGRLREVRINSVYIHEPTLVQAQPCLRFQYSPHGSVQSLARNSSGLDRVLQCFECGIGNRRH